MPKEIGRLLKQAEIYRYLADYEGDAVHLDDARQMVEQAEASVAAVKDKLLL